MVNSIGAAFNYYNYYYYTIFLLGRGFILLSDAGSYG